MKNLLVYGGLTKEEFEQARPYRDNSNLKLWQVLSFVLTGVFMGLTLYYVLEQGLLYMIIINVVIALYCLIIALRLNLKI